MTCLEFFSPIDSSSAVVVVVVIVIIIDAQFGLGVVSVSFVSAVVSAPHDRDLLLLHGDHSLCFLLLLIILGIGEILILYIMN